MNNKAYNNVHHDHTPYRSPIAQPRRYSSCNEDNQPGQYNINKLITKISIGQSRINLSALPEGMLIFVVGDRRFKVLKKYK